jgi:hypothetical protein
MPGLGSLPGCCMVVFPLSWPKPWPHGQHLLSSILKNHCVGQEINANHVRAVSDGWVYGVARPLHLGRTSHVWNVRISDESGKLVCVSRVTMAVLQSASRYGRLFSQLPAEGADVALSSRVAVRDTDRTPADLPLQDT